jgi:hypothetical protein|tara:strand:- start:126 stop:320 length:195 start_codon:yes stop_codon:yes gene_type:complete
MFKLACSAAPLTVRPHDIEMVGTHGKRISQEGFEFPDIDAAIGGLDDLFSTFDIKRLSKSNDEI